MTTINFTCTNVKPFLKRPLLFDRNQISIFDMLCTLHWLAIQVFQVRFKSESLGSKLDVHMSFMTLGAIYILSDEPLNRDACYRYFTHDMLKNLIARIRIYLYLSVTISCLSRSYGSISLWFSIQPITTTIPANKHQFSWPVFGYTKAEINIRPIWSTGSLRRTNDLSF